MKNSNFLNIHYFVCFCFASYKLGAGNFFLKGQVVSILGLGVMRSLLQWLNSAIVAAEDIDI